MADGPWARWLRRASCIVRRAVRDLSCWGTVLLSVTYILLSRPRNAISTHSPPVSQSCMILNSDRRSPSCPHLCPPVPPHYVSSRVRPVLSSPARAAARFALGLSETCAAPVRCDYDYDAGTDEGDAGRVCSGDEGRGDGCGSCGLCMVHGAWEGFEGMVCGSGEEEVRASKGRKICYVRFDAARRTKAPVGKKTTSCRRQRCASGRPPGPRHRPPRPSARCGGRT